jgi:cation/acetate symporter
MGYDGFLYSVGYLAGWIVALFVVAEPMKRLNKYTFTDALDAKFNSKGIQLMAAISTLALSVFYLIPQMVGAGVPVTPLLDLPHWVGVIMAGIIVITIVATAGMTSTTYVQFLKGGLLIIFSTVLSVMVLNKGLTAETREETFVPQNINAAEAVQGKVAGYTYLKTIKDEKSELSFIKLEKEGVAGCWIQKGDVLEEAQTRTNTADGKVLYNGAPKEDNKFKSVGYVSKLVDEDGKEIKKTGSVGIFQYFSSIDRSEIVLYPKSKIAKLEDEGDKVQVYCPVITSGSDLLHPGQKYKIKKNLGKLNFISLMTQKDNEGLEHINDI